MGLSRAGQSWCLYQQLRNQVTWNELRQTHRSHPEALVHRRAKARREGGREAAVLAALPALRCSSLPSHLRTADLLGACELSLLRLCSPEARTSSRKLTKRFQVIWQKSKSLLKIEPHPHGTELGKKRGSGWRGSGLMLCAVDECSIRAGGGQQLYAHY